MIQEKETKSNENTIKWQNLFELFEVSKNVGCEQIFAINFFDVVDIFDMS